MRTREAVANELMDIALRLQEIADECRTVARGIPVEKGTRWDWAHAEDRARASSERAAEGAKMLVKT